MTAAEKGLPARALDRSPPGIPVDTSILSSGQPLATDDEAQGAPAQEEPQQTSQTGEQRKSFWDWLFSSSDEKKPAQNPAPQDDQSGGGN
jgi:hypothetical protein